jgi:hypothetical protein
VDRMRLHARYAREGVCPADAEVLAHHLWEVVGPADAGLGVGGQRGPPGAPTGGPPDPSGRGRTLCRSRRLCPRGRDVPAGAQVRERPARRGRRRARHRRGVRGQRRC